MSKPSKVVDLNSHRQDAPAILNGKVPPRRRANAESRSREFLTPDEVARLIKAAGESGRHRHRDRTLVMMAYRHALRVSELVALRWDALDLLGGEFHVRRLKNGAPSTHLLRGPAIRALRRLARDYPATPYVFVSERGGPLTTSAVRKIVARAGEVAELPFPVHPHMLRHALGYRLANKGHDTRAIQHYMGHRNIQHTVRYTELSPAAFVHFFDD